MVFKFSFDVVDQIFFYVADLSSSLLAFPYMLLGFRGIVAAWA